MRFAMAVKTSPRPLARPEDQSDAAEVAVASMAADIAGALAEATAAPPAPGTLDAQALEVAANTIMPTDIETLSAPPALTVTAASAARPVVKLVSTPRPPKRKATAIYEDIAVAKADAAQDAGEVVTRLSTSEGRAWGINVGRFNSQGEAERVLLKTQLVESATLGVSLRKISKKSGGFDANFLGLTQDEADLACRRLQARGVQCFTMGP